MDGASSSSAKVPSEPNPSSDGKRRIEDDDDDAGEDWAIPRASQLIQDLKRMTQEIMNQVNFIRNHTGGAGKDFAESVSHAHMTAQYVHDKVVAELQDVMDEWQRTSARAIGARISEATAAGDLLEALLKQEDAANEKMAALEAENKELKQKVESFRNGTASCAVCLTEKAVYGIVHDDTASGHLCCCETCRGRMRDNSCLVCRVPGTWVRMFY
jgi:hypothetical protein